MRIAGPLLAATTVVGVAIGVREAWRFHWWLALLMALLVGIVATLFVLTVRRIRAEACDGDDS